MVLHKAAVVNNVESQSAIHNIAKVRDCQLLQIASWGLELSYWLVLIISSDDCLNCRRLDLNRLGLNHQSHPGLGRLYLGRHHDCRSLVLLR